MDKPQVPLYVQVAQRLIEQLKAGTSPWQKPWNGGAPPGFSMPYNQQSGQRYKGINAMNLLLTGRSDPRWLTFKQAEAAGFRVMHKEKGSLIQFVKTHELISLRDDRGKPLYDDLGNLLREKVALNRPIVSNAWVFNAEQISGLPPLAVNNRKIDWDPTERAEELIRHSGAQIEHKFIDRAFYHIRYDVITMPDRSQFSSSQGYYATLLHELAHWTGHPTRLERETLMTSGIEAYAKEELRAEIASMLLGDELQIAHDPSQHAAYIESWVSILENTPVEIHAAAMDAEKIFSFLRDIELKAQKDITMADEAAIAPGPVAGLNYLSTGDEISYKHNLYRIQGHLKQGRLHVQQQPSGLQFTLSKSDQLYRSLLDVKLSGLLKNPAAITASSSAPDWDAGTGKINKR
ncbi:conjugal transfer protein TraC [Pedobacter sp. Leaf216]|uniref:ArdC family protein n=1 Tax=Pedobacter sp. Leaf216 TaxID=1735684 RepID=UPI0006F82054|nr:zincin-like metallopeptidase domain-containing protein [Pedobacter sp. Leaf216]KQM63971.1 conjugal transfer protein TraC [Pedobacter sp. Leaf216]